MTDNRTTELLRKLLDERGVKYSDFTSATKNGKAIFKTRWKHECGYAELSEWESTGSNNLFIQNVDPEQAVAATLGSDKPPYDELLRCLENDWHIHASWDGLRKFWCIELTEEGVRMRDAAHAERTCEIEHVKGGAMYDVWRYTCCGYEYAESVSEMGIVQNYCPNCGCKVVGE